MTKKESNDEKNTVTIENLPDLSSILGCFTKTDDFTHLGALFVRRTACGKPMGDTILSRDITINCPDCVAEIRYRSEHPEAARKEMGVVTHKRKR